MPFALRSRSSAFLLALTVILGLGAATAVSAQGTGAPAGFVAQAEPKAEETNAERAKTQPGNNAPMWRAEVPRVPSLSTRSCAETRVFSASLSRTK